MLDAEKDGEKSDDLWLDLSNEETSNWLMFVRPAQNHLEQNLVAYQYGSEIFYATIKNIQPKQELKVSALALLCVFQATLYCCTLIYIVVFEHTCAGVVCSLLCRVCQSEDPQCNRRGKKRLFSRCLNPKQFKRKKKKISVGYFFPLTFRPPSAA